MAEEEERREVGGVEAEAVMEGEEEGATRRMLVLEDEGMLVEVVLVVEEGLVAEEVGQAGGEASEVPYQSRVCSSLGDRQFLNVNLAAFCM